MDGLTATSIPLAVRIEMCRAAVQLIADRQGTRLLHIKGGVLDASIRPIREGTDVDVIVDPARIGDMHRALIARGWSVYSTFDEGSPFGHAQTYWHHDWGYIDLHRRFPGIRLDDSTAFETLWRGHAGGTAAGLAIIVPGLTAQVVLFLLNAARGAQRERDDALAFRRSLPIEQLRSIDELIRELDAEVAASVITGELDDWRRRREYLLWRSIVDEGTRSQEWWGRVRAARSAREAAEIVMRAPRVNRSRLAHQLGRTPTRRDLMAAAFRRVQAAARDLLPGRGRRDGRR